MDVHDVPFASLEGLPDDVLAHVFELLDSASLARLRQVSRQMDQRVLSLGIPLYITHNPVPSTTLSPAPEQWDPKRLFYHTTRISAAVARHELYALQVGSAWARTIPVLALAPDALVIGCGSTVRVHPLNAVQEYAHRMLGGGVAVVDVAAGDTAKRRGGGDSRVNGAGNGYAAGHAPRHGRHGAADTGTGADIVGIHVLPSTHASDFVVAQFDGTVQRFTNGRSAAHYAHPGGIHSLSGHGSLVLSVSGAGGSANMSSGSGGGSGRWRSVSAFSSTASTPTARPPPATNVPAARLFNATSPWVAPSTLALPGRAWSAHLTAKDAYFGLRGGIHRHAISGSSLSDTATDIFLPVSDDDNGMPSRSAAYGLATFPTETGSPLASTLLSAWHDGTARLHDLRTRAQVLALTDPWSDSALFSAAFAGAHGVAAGGAEHGIVNVWDVRYVRSSSSRFTSASPPSADPGASLGWSVFSPHGRGSPVYALAGDGGRVWGATERRAFVLAFDEADVGDTGVPVEDLGGQGQMRGRKGSATKEVPSGWRPRGGKVGWTVHYGQHALKETVMGYRHGEGGMSLFESRVR